MKHTPFVFMALMTLTGASLAATSPGCELTSLQTAAGYVTFANTVKFFAAVAGTLFFGIFLYHLRTLFGAIPLVVWKALGYGICASLCASSYWMAPDHVLYGQFVGACLSAGALALIVSDIAHALNIKTTHLSGWHLSVAVLGSTLALLQSNPMVAAVGVAGFIALMGFSILSVPGMVSIGFDSSHSLWKATFSALAILVPTALYRAAFGSLQSLEIFWPSIAWICSLCAGTGLLIASSRFFTRAGGPAGYFLRNLAMLAFGLFCIGAGEVYGMAPVERVGGTLLAVWLFEKPWDIPKVGLVGYSFLGALSSAGLYFAMQQLIAHPEIYGKFFLF